MKRERLDGDEQRGVVWLDGFAPSYSGWRPALTALAVSGLFPQTITGVALDMVWSIEGTISSWYQLTTNVEMVDESSLGEIWDGIPRPRFGCLSK
jgi:hypothetical protein